MFGLHLCRSSPALKSRRGRRLIIAAVAAGMHMPVSGQTEFHLGHRPSAQAQLAMPIAKCVWRRRHVDALRFVNDLERGLTARAIGERLASLRESCPELAGHGPQGDPVAALVYYRQRAVADCLAARAGRAYRAFSKTVRKGDGAAARSFVEQGFPEALRPAAEACDASLVPAFARQERSDFGAHILGWR